MLGPDPEQIMRAQEYGQYIECKATVNYPKKTITLVFSSKDQKGEEFIPELMSSFVTALSAQLSSFFAITGELIEEGRPDGL